MIELVPFADNAASIGKLAIENGTDYIALHDRSTSTRDEQGLAHARKLKTILNQPA